MSIGLGDEWPTLTREDYEYYRLAADTAGLRLSAIVAPRPDQVVLSGMRFHYLDWGNSHRFPSILFLHGGGLTAHTWDLVCLAMRSRFHCVALDQRGHGDSEWSPDLNYGFAAHRDDIERFVEALKLERFLLVGASLGGVNALSYVLENPGRVAGLVLVDVAPRDKRTDGRRVREFMALPPELPSVEDFVKRALSFNPRKDPRLLRRSLLFNLLQLPNGNWTWKYDPRLHSSVTAKNSQRERNAFMKVLWGAGHAVSCPTLLVRGAQSDVVSRKQSLRFIKTFPDGRFVEIAEAGHTVHGDNPRDFIEALFPFAAETGQAKR